MADLTEISRLLEVDTIRMNSDDEMVAFINKMNDLIEEYGADWVAENKDKLKREWAERQRRGREQGGRRRK